MTEAEKVAVEKAIVSGIRAAFEKYVKEAARGARTSPTSIASVIETAAEKAVRSALARITTD